MITTSCDEGDNDKDASNSDEELIAIAERDFKRQARQSADHLEKLLDATYPNHTYRIRHKLKECTMVKNYKTTRTFRRSKKPEGDWTGKAAAPFPEGKAVTLQAQTHQPSNQHRVHDGPGVLVLGRIPDHF
jgi:hypothetical protein